MHIKFHVKLGESAAGTLETLHTAFDDEALNRITVFEWHSCFEVGSHSFENYKFSGQLNTSKTDENAD